MTRKPEGWPCSVVMCLTTSEYTVTGSGPPEQAAPASRASARVKALITGEIVTRNGAPGRYTWPVPRRGTSPPSSSGPGYRPFKAATRVRIPLGARNRIAGPVEQSGRARHPVKVEVAGSNPVRPAPAPGRRRSGEVAQLAEHAAENRGVGGSNPSLATTLTWANVPRFHSDLGKRTPLHGPVRSARARRGSRPAAPSQKEEDHMRSSRLNPEDVHPPVGNYSHAVRMESTDAVWIHVSGQVALDRDGQLVGPGDLRAQTRQVLENLKAILEANGASFADVVKTTTYLTTLDDLAGMREVRAEYLPEEPPASTAVQISALVLPEALIEVDAIAVVPR